MGKKIGKHIPKILPLKKPLQKENLKTWSGDVPLNIAKYDRISFSVLINEKRNIRKIENISYDILIENEWVWIIRFDDHGGVGLFHKHTKITLNDERDIESYEGVKKSKSKRKQFNWAFKDIKRNYLIYRSKFLKNSGLDLY
ncbi:MAG: hypothetical protein AAB609_01845 [Patescibacteria group bacterium]